MKDDFPKSVGSQWPRRHPNLSLSPRPSFVFPVCEGLGDRSVPRLPLWFQAWGEVASDLGVKIG